MDVYKLCGEIFMNENNKIKAVKIPQSIHLNAVGLKNNFK